MSQTVLLICSTLRAILAPRLSESRQLVDLALQSWLLTPETVT